MKILVTILLFSPFISFSQSDTSYHGWEKQIVLTNWPKETNELFWWPDYSEKQITWRPVLKKQDSTRRDVISVFGEPITILTIDTIKALRAESIRRKIYLDSVIEQKRKDSIAFSFRLSQKPIVYKGGTRYEDGNERIEIINGKKVKTKSKKKKVKYKTEKGNNSKAPHQYYYIIQTNQKLENGVEYHSGLIIVHKKFKNKTAALAVK